MNKELQLKNLAKLNRLIMFEKSNKETLIFLKRLRSELIKNIKNKDVV